MDGQSSRGIPRHDERPSEFPGHDGPEGRDLAMNLQGPPQPQKDILGIAMTALLLLSFAALLVSFFWVLFFSPTGRSETVLVDFNKFSPADNPESPSPDEPGLRVAIASMVSPQDTYDLYGELVHYLGEKIGKKPRVIQRTTYRQVNHLLVVGRIDLGFICSGPYLQLLDSDEVNALVMPIMHAKNYYHAYIIVHRNSPYESFGDLRGKVFAFMDRDSLTGFVYPSTLLQQMNETTKDFFHATVSTRSHTDSIHAVFYRLADGASVSSAVYDYYQKWRPEKTKECRIIEVSEPMGMPPVVAGRNVSEPLQEKIKQALLQMHEDPYGKEILGRMNIDSFAPVETGRDLYEETRQRFYPDAKPTSAVQKQVLVGEG